MRDRVTREVEGRTIVVSGSLVCPHPDRCDIGENEGKVDENGRAPESYVRRHAHEHDLGDFESRDDAERNLGVWCSYFFHKYIWGNDELHPYPHWEIHAFITEREWSETDLQQRIPLNKRRVKGYLPPADQRRIGEFRQFRQVEVPRQCQKSSIARAYVLFRSLHEYFVNDRRNYRIILRSAVSTLVRQGLTLIRRMASKSERIAALYGTWLARCGKCGTSWETIARATQCKTCESARVANRRISLLNPTLGSGSTGKDQIALRWLTESADAVAAYSVWVAGLQTSTTGQRPDLYVLDDIQTTDNSDTVEKRAAIQEDVDGAIDELQFGGEMLVFDTRKYISDFAGSIQKEPRASQFHSLRREVRWRTDEPDNAPWVVDGWRYYYPIRGNGKPALDAEQVRALRKKKNFATEYMNDPIDEETATFKRSDFIVLSRSDDRRQWPEWQTEAVPIEIVAGLGGAVAPDQQRVMDALNVRIVAMNACDPADAKKTSSDETFIVASRMDRYGRPWVTRLAAGRWPAKRRWSEIEQASTYNLAKFTDYEMGVEEDDIRASFDKWVRDRSDELTQMFGEATIVRPPMRWSKMPKSGKMSRIEEMHSFLPIYILDDAGSDDLIEKFIAQYVGLGVEDHDDGPDAHSRLIPEFARGRKWKAPADEDEQSWVDPKDGAAYVPLSAIKGMARTVPTGLWGERG